LNLLTIRFPVTAIVSILHRLSGVVLFLLVPFLVWAFQASLVSPTSFDSVIACLQNPVLKLLLWVFSIALIYHLLAGLRHFVMDFGWGESLQGGRMGAWGVLILTGIFAVIGGGLIW
jgi:succinate dehydrogenase / fumarate reductase cytochrome b subunit